MVDFSQLLEFLNNSFILIVGTGLLKAIYTLFRMNIQTNENTKDIKELQNFTGLNERRVTDGFRSSSKSARGGA